MKVKHIIIYIVLIILGALLGLLGGLWLLQGLDLVRIEPVACVGDCQPITGGSAQWSVIGGVVLAVGIALIYVGARFFYIRSRSQQK